MLALGIRYLTGYAAATDVAAQAAEWPPHWGRVFMAMAAAHFENGGDAAERAALEWIEAAPVPALRASDADEPPEAAKRPT
jgi:CRISPR-associated protein Csb2